MIISRRTLLAGGSTAIVAGGIGTPYVARAQQAEFTYKYANNVPLNHPTNVRAQEAAAAIKEETNGRFALQIFPSSQLGSDTDLLSQLRAGAIDFFTLSGLILSTLVPAASISGMGFVFPDYEAVWMAMDGDLGAHIRQQILKANLVPMDKIWDNGFRQITSSTKPINTPSDLKSFKIRVPVSPLGTTMFRAFEASPTAINANEMYTALQTRVVDGQENPLSVVDLFKLYEVQKYCSFTNHMWDGFWFLANRRSLERLPPDVRAVVTRHIDAAAFKQRQDMAALNTSLQPSLASKGVLFNSPDLAPFRSKLRGAGFYGEWKRKYGEETWAVLEKSVGALG